MLEKLKITDFRGMITIGDGVDIPDNYAYEVRDIIFSPLSAISSRMGFLKQNTSSLGYEVKGLYQFRKSGDTKKTLVADSGGNLEVL